MVIRLLSKSDWQKLAACPGLQNGALPSPEAAMAVVAEDERGTIHAYWILQQQVCAEPVWIAQEDRGGRLGHAMYRNVQKVLREKGIQAFLIHAPDETTADYLDRLGLALKLGWETFQGRVD